MARAEVMTAIAFVQGVAGLARALEGECARERRQIQSFDQLPFHWDFVDLGRCADTMNGTAFPPKVVL
jgi:hypothetical protein